MFHRCVTCVESGVLYLSSKVGSITEAPDGLRFVSCEKNTVIPCRYESGIKALAVRSWKT
ncbi:unnamed protein product [Brassica rapa subsp. narinosa]